MVPSKYLLQDGCDGRHTIQRLHPWCGPTLRNTDGSSYKRTYTFRPCLLDGFGVLTVRGKGLFLHCSEEEPLAFPGKLENDLGVAVAIAPAQL